MTPTPNQLIFNAFNNMLGGILSDSVTAILGCIVVLSILAGFKIVIKILHQRNANRYDDYITRNGLEDDYKKMRNKYILKLRLRNEFEDF